MTTIAYKDGVVAYDGRATSGNIITEDNFEKHFEVDETHFFISGSISDFENFIDCFMNGARATKHNDCCGLVYHEGKLYVAAVGDDVGFWKRELNMKNNYSVGSGDQFALSAMDLGKTAEEAIEFAATRDCKTGGMIRTFDLV